MKIWRCPLKYLLFATSLHITHRKDVYNIPIKQHLPELKRSQQLRKNCWMRDTKNSLNQLSSVTRSLADAAVTPSSSSSSDSGCGNCSERRQWPRGLCPSPSTLACFIAEARARARRAGLQGASAAETLRLLLIASARAVVSLAHAPLSPPARHSSSAQLSSVQSDLSTWRANLTHCIRPISDGAAVQRSDVFR